MGLRPAISAPLPWLTIAAGRFLGRSISRTRAYKFPRSLRITREGWWFIAILMLIGLAAINTGNNLLYLVVATLLSLIIISGILSESTLRRVRVQRRLPERIFKGEPVRARLAIENTKWRMPSFSFTLKELPAPGLTVGSAYVLKLKPNEKIVKTAEYTFTKRGPVTLHGVKVSTRFPFGLFLKGKEETSLLEAVVYPSITRPLPNLDPGARTGAGEAASFGKGHGAQLYGLREYTLHDDSRFIHWKSAARTSWLLVKELEKESARRVTVVFDNYSSQDAEGFEDAVDTVAGEAARLIELGWSVGMRTLSTKIKPGTGTAQLHRILTALAYVGPVERTGTVRVTVIPID